MITYGSTTLTSYNSIVKTEVYYYKSTSATSLSGGSWSTTKPTWENGKYIWQKIRTVYEDGTHSESDPVNITGQQGATGTAAYSYKLNSSDSIIGKTKDGEYTIKKITFSATYKQGTGAVSAYSGRFKIESTTNGSTWKTEYTSSGNEASKEFTIPDDIILIKCSLYQSDGTTVLLDIVTVPVVKDGVDAIGLRDSIPYYLASDKDTGITRLTQGWTRYRPQLTAEKKYLWVYYVSRYSEGTTEPELIEIKDDLVHFINNGDESPVESCVVDIEPVQDLHGYDSPWPAGGGVNKFDIDNIKNVSGAYGLTTSIDGDIIRISGTYTGTSGGSAHRIIYHDQPIIEDAKFAIFRLDTNSAIISLRYASTSDNSIVVGISNMTPNTDVDVRFRFMIYTGSTAPTSYSPYSNICPITGFTKARIWNDPKYAGNIRWNQIWYNPEDFGAQNTQSRVTVTDGVVTATLLNGTPTVYAPAIAPLSTSVSVTTLPSHKYYLACKFKPATDGFPYVRNNTAFPIAAIFGTKITTGGTWGTYENILTATDTGGPAWYLGQGGDTNDIKVGDSISIKDVMCVDLTEMFGSGNEPSTIEEFKALFPADYYPFDDSYAETCVSAVSGDPCQQVEITFPSETGTIYGGQLNITTGELVIDRAMVDLSSYDISWSTWGVNYRKSGVTGFYIYRNSMPSTLDFSNIGKAVLTNLLAINNGVWGGSKVGYNTNASGASSNWYEIVSINNETASILSTDTYAEAIEKFKAFLESTPLNVLYELVEPITYHLTPQEIAMLCQENNIFADTGQTAISYYDNQTSTDPYVDYSLTSAFDASTIEPAYIETEWVESTGKQYVYLDWKPPIKTWGFEIDFISYNALGTSAGAWNEDTNKNGYGTIFGVRNASGINNAQLSSYSNGTLRIGNGANQTTGFKTNHTRQQIKLQNTTITKTDGTTSTVSRLDETANKPYCNMTVFGLHDGLRRAGNGGISEPSSTRIYSLKFYDGDTLTVDLVGAIRKRDSVTGLYDKISKHFYPAPGMLFGDVVGDIGDSISMKEAMDKANPQTIVVNKDRTRMWEATVPFNDLQDGQKITVTYSYGNIVSSVETDELIGWDDTSNNQQVYLKLTFADGHKTDWIPCYYSNTSRLTTHYGAGIPIQLTYRENILANASETASGNMVLRGFFADANYDSNNTDIVRWSYGRVIAGSNKIFPYSIIMQNEDERWESIVTSSTTAKTKTRNTHGFRLDTILYQAANTTTNENAENTSYQLRTGDPIMDMRYNLNIEDTNELRLVHGKSVYLVGTVGTDGLFYLADQWWSQSLPTTEDGKIYIFLGQVYDWYRCGLATMHPIYKFVDGKLKSTLQIAVDALDKAKEVAQDLADLGADLQAQIDGKIETWCQITDPSTAWTTTELKNQHNGDLWYYTGESTSSYKNNTTYKYTASTNKWTAYSASTDLFDKIDTKASIYYGKPSAVTQNLEVGDYLVDSTDGCSYRWDGSKWVKLTDYNAAIDAIEIGGKNLLRGTRTQDTSLGNYKQNVTAIDESLFGCTVFTSSVRWADIGFDFKKQILDRNLVKAGDSVTYSIWAKTDDTEPRNILGVWVGSYYSGTTIAVLSSEWTQYSKTFIITEEMLEATSAIQTRFECNTDCTEGKYIYWAAPKLERGTKATDWTLAPEDTEAEISTLQEDLQSQIDEKIQTYYQSTNPASAWTTADIRATHDGDLWCYTGTTTSTYTKDNVYRYNASNNTWTTYSASGDLFDKVDGKTTVFYGKTTDTFADVETGDYLVDATDGSSYRYDGSKWVKVTDYQAAIGNMSIGGRNLFVTASRFHPEENAFTTTSTGKDNHIENFNVKGGIYTVEPFKAGDVITLQAQSNLPWNNRHASDGTAPNTVGFWIQAYDTMEDARARRNLKRSQFLTNDLGENHTSFLRTFTVPQSDDGRYYNFRFNSYSDGTQSVTAQFWDLQLERGNKATSWSPALEDLQVNIEGAEKRNLLLNTQEKTYSGYTMYYDLSESGQQLQEGEVVTFSMKATVPADRKRWAIYNSGGYLAISQWEAIEPDGETAVIYTWTGVWKLYWNDEPVTNDKLHVYIGTSGATSSVTVEWAKLERGNTMSTYSPAPEDINSSINAAQTTADEALAATQPISSKTFTGVIGTANDLANASFYFAKVHPTTYTDPWMVKMKIKASVPSDTNFRKTVDITIHGCRSNFISYDSIVANYNSNPIYYLNLYRATQAGIATNKKGHALGFGLRSATSPTDTNKKRTFEVDLLEVDGCTVDWIDTPVKYADMDGTGSTNYVGCTELGITSNGQNATNNDNTYDRIKYSTIKAAEAIARYNIIVGTSAGYKHLKSGTPWDITYPILYADAALNANATGSSNYLTIPFTVTTTQNMTLTPYKPVYIEGTLDGITFTPIDTTPLTQTVPTSDNGHQYILLGSAYSTTAINLEAEHPIYQFQNGNFVTVAEAASRIGANAENLVKATYAVCSTAAGANAKTADCTNFELYEGVRIQVTFTNANTAEAPTLNIHNTGAKAIYINKTITSSSNLLLWTAGSKMEFVYDGTGWIAQNVPYALYGTCSTGASTAAKAVTCNEAVICKGTTISVNMTNTNTAANATMNVGSTLAKDIYANGAKLTTNSRFNWRANTTQKFVFDGQVWRMDDDSVKALATAYITEIDDDGIMVHPEDDDTSGWAISDAIQLFKNGISYIKLWIENNIPKIRIGKEDQGHIILDNDSVDIRNDNKVLASFGATSVIGDENDWHQTIAANQITFAKGDDIITYISPDKLYTINAEVADAFYISNYSIRNASDGKLVIGLRR